ncbi:MULTISPECIES: hypothetical protein [unclassified Mesorhizobium]|uniref:hypothetical protein n=1 Tax=unclassified Mesorhizobium TaxID=325217 RepID=UPI001FE026AD|nr:MULTISPECIES: hypothetical protein [unclassified Mesorhizobium]
MLRQMQELFEFFGPHVRDTETLDRLRTMVKDRGAWLKAHHLFDHIRHKTLRAEKANDVQALAQYMFEEVCAKALFNLTHSNAPFDADSPYWCRMHWPSLACWGSIRWSSFGSLHPLIDIAGGCLEPLRGLA